MEDIDAEPSMEHLTLDILGQAERINRLYTQVTLCFPIQDDSRSLQKEIIDNLEIGLARLSKSFPWIAGKVIQNDGIFKITPAETALRLVVKELQDHDTVPSWGELKQANFPFRMLDEDVVAPCRTMVEPEAERPVLMVQAYFVKGGLLLTINAQHGSMDMTGQGQLVALFAKACRGEDFTKDEVAIGNMQRTDRIPIRRDETPSNPDPPQPEQAVTQHVEADAKPREAEPSSPSDALVWAYFDFSAASLASLKEVASQELTSYVTFVSTDDVLTAFIWQSLTRARHPRLDHPRSTPTTLSRNVDVRSYFDLPSTYPGLMTTAVWPVLAVDDIVNHRSIGSIASFLRATLIPGLLRANAEFQASVVARNQDAAAQRSIAGLSDPRFDVRLSSWAKEKLHDLDFGPCLGRPEAVRRPRFGNGAREGLVYFLPKGRDGSIVVGICLRDEDMERLRKDEQVLRWATWIG